MCIPGKARMINRQDNYDLSAHNTFGLKVKCAAFVEYDSATDVVKIDFDSLPQPLLHIGSGSNLLFTGDFPGTILHSAIKFTKYIDMGIDSVLMAVGAGVTFDDFCAKACEAGYWGAENLSLIPGEVGAAAVQNIGAYGVEAKDIIAGVVCYDMQQKCKTVFKTHECDYAYRDSMFKHNRGRYIITSVLFRLTRKYSPKLDYGGVRAAFDGVPPQTPMDVRNVIIGIRRAKLPDPSEKGSAGSFFKNPVIPAAQFRSTPGLENAPHYDFPDGSVKVPAAWLIDTCGLKGAKMGGAAVYDKQPLVLVNDNGGALAGDILALEKKIIETVKDRFGITLCPEVDHI